MRLVIKDASARWKILLALLVATFLAGMIVTFVLAAQRVSTVVDKDCYSKALRYGLTASGATNAGLGWTLSAALAGNRLQVKVRDAAGAPVAGGELKFEPEGDAGGRAPLLLAETAPGTFQAPWPISSQSELRGTLHFTRGEAFAEHRLVLIN